MGDKWAGLSATFQRLVHGLGTRDDLVVTNARIEQHVSAFRADHLVASQ